MNQDGLFLSVPEKLELMNSNVAIENVLIKLKENGLDQIRNDF